jgi:hypothetical protein
MEMLILAGIAGWAGDDWCPTPPRPPWPGPWSWWIRKILAVIGGIAAHEMFNRGTVGADTLTVAVVGAVGGIFLASVVGGIAGMAGANRQTTVNG